MRKYNIINNTLGWLTFVVAAITYLLTIEPTASFWDCPEFIAQGFKLEIGHPPGNPIFILAARFAANFAGGDVTAVAKCVNSMSALLSAATILLLFWTITHLVKKLLVTDGEEDKMSVTQYIAIMGSGIAGALAYTWSDTFWFSAVEAEVYAFSSFCTALVFWLILKWEDHADEPSSDRYIVLIAYVFGISLGVHLLNLLCIPAIVLVFYYRKFSKTSLKGSLLALLVSFGIIVLILYGLEPGFVELAQYFELFFTNTVGLSFNVGTLIYALLTVAVFSWSIWELYRKNRSDKRIKVSFFLSILMSGIPFIGESMIIPVVILVALAWWLAKKCNKIPVRIFTNVVLSIFMIFLGFSSYALILIRSNANTPLDENSPNSVFALQSYLSREQYGKSPLLYGQTMNSSVVYQNQPDGTAKPLIKKGRTLYAREVKANASDPDRYKAIGNVEDYQYNPELNMLFPRVYSSAHIREYTEWLNLHGTQVDATTRVDADGNAVEHEPRIKPTFLENLTFFIDYQLNYMYWRYFMWNFAGRQNDIQGMGEITQGNWISGIPFIDNLRLGDQSLMPADLTTGNKGHNVFYMLPLLLGIIGLLWQAYSSKKGIEQFWVVFFLFFMTGIAIVMYLNQTPSQPRERDYAYAGSFYAFAIWIGMGVAGIWRTVLWLLKRKAEKNAKGAAAKTAAANSSDDDASSAAGKTSLAVASMAAVIGLLVPIQMVSQTWDDHDRSDRYAARDFGANYLAGVDKNGIIFCNGDNDTFPLWYNQEVEGYRTDVRVVNLSYLSTDWYISQMQRAAYESAPLPMQAGPTTFAYNNRQYNYFIAPDTATRVPVIKSLQELYSPACMNNGYGVPEIKYPNVFINIDADKAVKAGVVPAGYRDQIQETIDLNLMQNGGGMSSSQVMSLDMIASSIAQGWKRPCYFAMTVPDNYYLGLSPYLRNTGLCYQVTPLRGISQSGDIACNTDKMYETVMTKFRWGGIDKAKPGSLYLDETIRRMVTTIRSSLIDLATDLTSEGAAANEAIKHGQTTFMGQNAKAYCDDRFAKAEKVLNLMEQKLPAKSSPYAVTLGLRIAQTYQYLAENSGSKTAKAKALKMVEDEILRYGSYMRFYQSLSARNYDRLTNNDRYIDQHYAGELISYYGSLNPSGLNAVIGKLEKMGVNIGRLNSFMQQTSQMQAQSAEPAPVDTPLAAAGDSQASGSLLGY